MVTLLRRSPLLGGVVRFRQDDSAQVRALVDSTCFSTLPAPVPAGVESMTQQALRAVAVLESKSSRRPEGGDRGWLPAHRPCASGSTEEISSGNFVPACRFSSAEETREESLNLRCNMVCLRYGGMCARYLMLVHGRAKSGGGALEDLGTGVVNPRPVLSIQYLRLASRFSDHR